MTRRRLVIAIAVGVAAAAAVLLATSGGMVPAPSQGGEAPPQRGGRFQGGDEQFAGYGWSIHPDTRTAVEQALATAEGGTPRRADITLVFYTSRHAPEQVAQALLRLKDRTGRICGWSSDHGIVAPDGYHCSPAGVVGLMSLRLPGVKVGTGWARLDETNSPGDCAKLALRRAIENAGGQPPTAQPSLIIMSSTYDGQEEKYLEALTGETNGLTPILGGTAAGTPEHGKGDSSVIAGDRAVREGLVLSVFYFPGPVGWSFRGGFDRTGSSGVITASEGRVIREIDGRPALDVYDEWSGGRIRQAMRAGKDMNTYTGLYPLCRTVASGAKSHNLFVHAWPPSTSDPTMSNCLVTSANLWKGDVVHFAEGSWNILLNRIGLLPQQAREGKPDMEAVAGLLVCCEAVLKNIPPDQRNQMAWLIGLSMGQTPWIGMFTWGEQGNFPGVGNCHGNLLTSFTLFPGRGEGAGGK